MSYKEILLSPLCLLVIDLTLKTKENKWLNSWTIGYYLFNLIRRYDSVDTLDLLIPNDIRGQFGYTTIKLLAETGSKIRLLTNSSIKDIHVK